MVTSKRKPRFRGRNYSDEISFRNTLVPIGRIPNEIILDIFIHLTTMLSPLTHECATDARNVSQVCRRWRSLAFSLPALWTHISLRTDPKHIRRMLARSCGRPLYVKVDALKRPVPQRNFQILSAEGHRMRGLALERGHRAYPTDDPVGRKLLTMALTSPVFEELLLSNMDLPHVAFEPTYQHARVVGPPTMKHLVLLNTAPSPAFLRPFVNSVTTFFISCPQSARWGLPWRESLIHTLALMPHLQHLTMYHTGDPTYPEFIPLVTPAYLPRLVSFTATHVPFEQLEFVIPALGVPPRTEFRINTFGDDSLSFLRAPSILEGVYSLSLTYIPSTAWNSQAMMLRGYVEDAPSPDNSPKMDITFRGAMARPAECLGDLSAFMRACSRPEVKTCELVDVRFPPRPPDRDHDGDSDEDEDEADNCSAGMGLPACSALRLVRCSLEVVSAVLEALGGWGVREKWDAPFCEGLRRVEVCGLHDEGEGEAEVVGELLARMVDRREGMNAVPLSRVVVTGMGRLGARSTAVSKDKAPGIDTQWARYTRSGRRSG